VTQHGKLIRRLYRAALIPPTGRKRWKSGPAVAPFFVCVAVAILIQAACSDGAVTPVTPKGTAAKSFGITDWYECTSYDGGETYYSCDYVGTTGQDSYYVYDYAAENQWEITREAPTDCMFDPAGCQATMPYRLDEPLPVPSSGTDHLVSDTALSPQTCRDTINLNLPSDAASAVRKFCNGKVPTNNRLFRINLALADMHAIGGICDTLATLGDSLLAHARIRVYTLNPSRKPGEFWAAGLTAGKGENGALMGQQNIWTDFLYDANHYSQHTLTETGPYLSGAYQGMVVRRNLQSSLAHELDHVAGRIFHLDPEGYLTTNQTHCGGLP
jgi:hypothetical protein